MPTDGGGGTSPDSPTAASTSPVSCNFGPFGEQTSVSLNMLGAQKLCKLIQLPSLLGSALEIPFS
jgi:hypothetical protein